MGCSVPSSSAMAMEENKATKDSDPQANRRWTAERRRRYYAGLGIPTQDDGDGEMIPTDEAWKQMYQRDLERARAYNRRYYEKDKASIKAGRQAYSRQYSATPHGKAVRKEYRATARGKARMKEAQRKYRASPRGKATRKKCDAAYYQDKKKKDALYYQIVRETKSYEGYEGGRSMRPQARARPRRRRPRPPDATGQGGRVGGRPAGARPVKRRPMTTVFAYRPNEATGMGKNTGLVGGLPRAPWRADDRL